MIYDWLVIQKQEGLLNWVVPVLLTCSVAVIKCAADRSNLKNEGFILVYNLRVEFITVGMSGWQGFEASSHNASPGRLSSFLEVQDPIPGNSVAP